MKPSKYHYVHWPWVQGSWDNVVGLPLKAALKLIEKVMAKADDDNGDEMLEGDEEEEE